MLRTFSQETGMPSRTRLRNEAGRQPRVASRGRWRLGAGVGCLGVLLWAVAPAAEAAPQGVAGTIEHARNHDVHVAGARVLVGRNLRLMQGDPGEDALEASLLLADVTTDADGRFFADVPPGQYEIIVWAQDFYPLRREVVAPWPTFDVGLEPAPGLLHSKLTLRVPVAPPGDLAKAAAPPAAAAAGVAGDPEDLSGRWSDASGSVAFSLEERKQGSSLITYAVTGTLPAHTDAFSGAEVEATKFRGDAYTKGRTFSASTGGYGFLEGTVSEDGTTLHVEQSTGGETKRLVLKKVAK